MVYLALAAIAIGYILGSIPSAYIITRLRKGIDIRQVGSHNMGTMNVLRTVGIPEAILVFIVDGGKGIITLFIAQLMHLPEAIVLTSGFVAIIGHIFPAFLGFRGGKGGATGLGMLAYFMPLVIPVYIPITILLALLIRNFTFGYGTAMLVFLFAAWFVYHSVALFVFAAAILVVLLILNLNTIILLFRRGIFNVIRERIQKPKK